MPSRFSAELCRAKVGRVHPAADNDDVSAGVPAVPAASHR